MAICASSGKPVLISTWLEDKLLIKQTKYKKQNKKKNTKQTNKPPCNTTTAMHEPDEMLPSLRRAEPYMQKLCHASNKQLELLKQDMVKLRIVLFPF